MSKIGNKPIALPSGVTVSVNGDVVEIKGSKGTLTVNLIKGITVEVADDQVLVKRANDEIQTKANHGLIRSLINNQIIGVSEGYKKTLKLIGTGYRVTAKGQGLSLAVGFSHPIEVDATQGVTFTLEGNDTINIEGIDKQAVGQVAANIRKVRPPEPYNGKGIRYIDEEVIRKAGKAAIK
jgi:large subunit ribosomal protein L6